MNAAQTVLVRTYGGGDYAFLETAHEDDELLLSIMLCGGMETYIDQTCGDTQFLALFRELADDGPECMPKAEAVRRIESAIEALTALKANLEVEMIDG